MIRHLFKLIWNQKRQNLGLLFEMLFSFMVLFAVFSFIMHNYHRYNQPTGFDHEAVWMATMHWPNDSLENVYNTQQRFRQQLKTYPQIEHFSLTSSNMPYSGSMSTTSVTYQEKSVQPYVYNVDKAFKDVMNMPVIEGRWFNPGERSSEGANIPIVINQTMREELFGTEKAIGSIIPFHDDRKLKVIGVVGNFKSQGEFSNKRAGMFFPEQDDYAYSRIMLKVKPNAKADFESRLLKDLAQISKGWTIDIAYMQDMRKDTLSETLIPMAIFLIIGAFLIFNVALGLFGVLWQNISKRREEIGIRRAMGATRSEISWQFITEVILLTTLSLVIGIFFAIQFPLLSVFNVLPKVYIQGILLSVLFIYSLVFICALYPSRQAAQLQPAMTLHEE